MRAALLLAAALGAASTVRAADILQGAQDFQCNNKGFNVQWTSDKRAVVVCKGGASNGGVGDMFETDDGGKTWQQIAPEVCQNRPRCVADVYREDASHLMITTRYGAEEWEVTANSIHRDATATYNGKALNLQRVIPHPLINDNGRVLGMVIPDPTPGGTPYVHYVLYHSTDFGKTFEPLPLPSDNHWVWYANWGEPEASQYDEREVFYITTKHSNPASASYDWTMLNAVNVVTGKTRTVVDDASYLYSFGGFSFYFVSKQHHKQDLYVSTDNGEHTNQVVLPNRNQEQGYTLLSVSYGVVFLAVYHQDCQREEMAPRWGSLYQSDRTGRNFYVSLPHIRMIDRSPDFHVAGALNGVYIANTAQVDEPDCRMCKSGEDCDRVCRHVTVISWENGDPDSWTTLRAPDAQRQDCQDSSRCNLHLHDTASPQEYIPPIYSKFDSPGIIVGAGNVDDSLDVSGLVVDMYLTLNGGEDWQKILDGPHTVDWTNYGGLMVAAPMKSDNMKSVKYSKDMGQTWNDIQFTSDEGMRIQLVRATGNQRADPQSSQFIVYAAHTTDGTNEAGVAFKRGQLKTYAIDINAATGHQKPCDVPEKGSAIPLTSAFQVFTPKNHKNDDDATKDSCFMGQNAEYLQKKPGQTCWNPVQQGDMESTWSVTPCPCKRSDYECAPGFRLLNNACQSEVTKAPVWDEQSHEFIEEKDSHVPVKCGLDAKDYMRTKGYTLKAGYMCSPTMDGAFDLRPIRTPCPVPESRKVGHFWPKFFITLLLLVGIIVGAIFFGASKGNPTCIALKMILEDLFGSCLAIGKEGVSKISQGYRPAQFEVDPEQGDDGDDNIDNGATYTSMPVVETAEPVGLVAAPRGTPSPQHAVADTAPPAPTTLASPLAASSPADADNDSFANFASAPAPEVQ